MLGILKPKVKSQKTGMRTSATWTIACFGQRLPILKSSARLPFIGSGIRLLSFSRQKWPFKAAARSDRRHPSSLSRPPNKIVASVLVLFLAKVSRVEAS